MSIIKGKLTWESEGMEGGPFHSRVLHVPSPTSGLTIGRGYDMKEKTREVIEADMEKAGLDPAICTTFGSAAGLYGEDAEDFIFTRGLDEFEITVEQQEILFKVVYGRLADDVKRICDKGDCVEVYGHVHWDDLDPKIKDVLVDLRFRGDYTPTARKLIQKSVVENDLPKFTELLANKDNWKNVPSDRYIRRVDFLT